MHGDAAGQTPCRRLHGAGEPLGPPSRDGPEQARRSAQDATHMPPSGDAQPRRPLLPSAHEGNTTGRKGSNGCPQARPHTARMPQAVAAGAICTARRGILCRFGRTLAGAGVSASGGPACYEIRVADVLDGQWAAWFDGLQVIGEGEETVICGLLADQPRAARAADQSARPRALPDRRAPAGHSPGPKRGTVVTPGPKLAKPRPGNPRSWRRTGGRRRVHAGDCPALALRHQELQYRPLRICELSACHDQDHFKCKIYFRNIPQHKDRPDSRDLHVDGHDGGWT